MPKDALTGTEKKAKKRDINFTRDQQKLYSKEQKHDLPYKHSSQKSLRDIAKGKHGPTTSLSELQDKLKRASKGAEKFYEPVQKQALQDFDRYTLPEVTNKFGRESGSGSSALNQAMAAARVDLQGRLASDFAGYKSQYAQNLVSQSEQGKLQSLNARLSANGGLMNVPIQPQMSGLANQPSYLQKNREPNLFNKIMAGGSTIAGGVAGGMATAGNPAGIAAGIQGGNAIGQLWT